MARYSEQHKQETRRRILDVAGRRLKRDGIDGSGIATLMNDADLTNGAFYAHFSSKEDLVAATVAEQIRGQRAAMAAVGPGRTGLERVVRSYLSKEHRDDPGNGCPSAALLDEIGRCPDSVRRAYTDGMVGMIDDLAARLAPKDLHSARVRVFGVFASMVGTLQLARALTDRELSDAVLERGVEQALRQLRA
jgi:AcrR family transcriptional regulator